MRFLLAVLTLSMTTWTTLAQAGGPLIDARMAQRDGDFETCAKKADEARRLPTSSYQSHRLFASCSVFAADEARASLTDAEYKARIESAIGALELLLRTPGAYHQPKANDVIRLSIEDFRRRIAGMGAGG